MANAPEASPSQVHYILQLQGKLGLSSSHVDVKHIYGKKSPGFKLTKAEASKIIDKLKSEVEEAGL